MHPGQTVARQYNLVRQAIAESDLKAMRLHLHQHPTVPQVITQIYTQKPHLFHTPYFGMDVLETEEIRKHLHHKTKEFVKASIVYFGLNTDNVPAYWTNEVQRCLREIKHQQRRRERGSGITAAHLAPAPQQYGCR